jgi:hypothetical protein
MFKWLKDEFYTNCLFFAWKKWRSNDGSYLLIRKSRIGWWWHFLWMSKDMKELQHFVPYEYKEVELIPPPLFKGYLKDTDT